MDSFCLAEIFDMYEGKSREEWQMVSLLSAVSAMPHSKNVKIDSFNPYAENYDYESLDKQLKELEKRNIRNAELRETLND